MRNLDAAFFYERNAFDVFLETIPCILMYGITFNFILSMIILNVTFSKTLIKKLVIN